MLAKILVVAEDKLIRWSIKEILTQEGYLVDTANSQDDSLNKISKNLYGLVFVDFEIAGKGSAEMQEIMTAIPQSTRIIVLSSAEGHRLRTILPGLTFLAVVKKPFSPEEIKESAKKALKLAN